MSLTNQRVYVVYCLDTFELLKVDARILGVFTAKHDALIAAIQATAEYVDYDWRNYSAEFVAEYRRRCVMDDLSSAIDYWNENHSEYQLFVDDSPLENKIDALEMEFPD